MSIPELKTPSLSVPSLQVPHLYVPRLQVPTLRSEVTHYSRRHKAPERRHVKDLGDIILGNPITGTRQLRETLVDYGMADLVYVPILNRIAGSLLMGYERTLVPLAKGNIGEAFVNNLESFGSTLDTLANPVKSLSPWAGGGSSTDLLKSMGWIDSQYRETYQYDTGYWLADVVLEVISDPANWLTRGYGALAKGGSGAATDAVEKSVVKHTGKTIIGASDDIATDKKFIKNLTEIVSASTADADDDLVKIIIDRIKNNRNQLDDLLKSTPVNSELYKLRKALLDDMNLLLKNDADGIITDMLYDIRMDKGFRYYRSIRKAELFAKKVDTGLLYAGLGTAPMFGAPAAALKKYGGLAYSTIKNKWLRKLNTIDPSELYPSNAGNIFKNGLHTIIKENEYMMKPVFDRFSSLLGKYDLDPKRLQLMYLEIYDNLKGSKRTTKEASRIFKKRLLDRMPELRQMFEDNPKLQSKMGKKLLDVTELTSKTKTEFDEMITAYQRQMAGKPITPDDLEVLTDVLALTAEQSDELSSSITSLIMDAVDTDFEAFLANNSLFDTPINKIHYAVTRYMQIDGIQYSLNNIEEFIAKLNETNPENYAKIMAILDYLGITVDTAKTLSYYMDNTINYNKLTDALNNLKTRLSNLHREYQSKVITLPDANSEQLKKYINELSDLLKRNNLNVDEVTKFIKKVQSLLLDIEEVPGAMKVNNLINRVRVRARTINKLNKLANRTNYTNEILEILQNNKRGSLPIRYGSNELQRIFKNFDFTEPKINVEDLADIRKHLLGHEETIAKIDEDFRTAREYQTKFMDDLNKTIIKHKANLDDIIDPLDTKMTPEQLDNYIKELEDTISRMPEPDVNLSYQAQLEFREEKTALERKLATLKRGWDTREGILSELHELDNYSGLEDEGLISEMTTSQLLHDLFSFELTKDYNLDDFDSLYEALKRRVKSWVANPKFESLSSKSQQFIKDLNNLFTDTKSHQLYSEALANLMLKKNRIYYMMLRKTNNPALLFNAIRQRVGKDGTWSQADKLWFEKLMDPKDDTLRKDLIEIAKIAREYRYDYLATDIEHILASLQQLQAYAAIEDVLRQKYSSKLSKEQCNYIINLIYNELINSKLNGSSAYNQADLERFMRRYKEQYYRSQYKYVEESALDIARKNGWIDNAAEMNEYFKQFPEEGMYEPIISAPVKIVSDDELEQAMYEAWVASQGPQISVMSDEDYIMNFERELMEDVRTAFSNYLATLNYISQNTNAQVTVAPMVNYDYMMNRIKELATDYLEIKQLLPEGDLREQLQTFVRNVGGSQMVSEMDNQVAKSAIDKFLSEEDNAVAGITAAKVAPNLNQDGIFDIMRQSFRDISTSNIMLAGKEQFVKVQDGIQHMSKYGLVTEFIDYSDLDAIVRATGYTENIYDYTLANDFGIAFKMYRVPELFMQYDLYNNAADTTGSFRQFVERYRRARAFLATSDTGIALNKVYLANVRQALIETYLKSDAPFAPKDAITYFKSLSDEDLRAWDMVTRISVDSEAVSKKYTGILEKRLKRTEITQKYSNKAQFSIGDRISYNEDPNSLYRSLEEQLSQSGFIEDTAFKEEINTVGYHQFANIREYAAASFKQWVKDPDTLLANGYNITQHIRNNVEAWENIRFIDRLTKNNKPVKLTQAQLKKLAQYGINEDTAMNSPQVLRYLTRERADVVSQSFKTWSANDIRSYLDYDTQGLGFLIYVDEYDVRNYKGTPYLVNRFTPEELAEAGIEIHQPFKDYPHIFVIRKSAGQIDVRPKTHKFLTPNYLFTDEQAEITKLLEANRHYYEYDGNSIHPEFYTGEVIDLDTYNTLIESEEIGDILGDDVERKSYSKTFAKGINNNFVLNTFIIGSPEATNELYSCMAQRFNALNKIIPYHSNELPRMIYSGTHTVISRANNAIKYLELFFNEDYYLGSEHFIRMFEKADDTDIKEFFKKGNFVSMVAKEAKDGSPAIYKYDVFNRKTLQEAIKQGAVVVPYEVYRNAVLSINKKQLNAKLFNIYRRTIVGTFKTIYLTSAGFLMRNEFDSAVYKNASTTEGVAGLYEVIKYQKRAWDMWKRYSEIQEAIIDSTKKDVDSLGTLNKRVTRAYLASLSEADQKTYMLVDTFVNSSASGGFSQALQDMLASYNFAGPIDMEMWEQTWNETILNGKFSPARWVMDLNSQIEQTSRLALFLKIVDESGDYTKALKEVVSTHFDYELKEPGMKLLEDIFWFSTFPINNIAYYLNEGLTRNPDIFKMYMDMLEQSWNNDDITWDDVRRNNYYINNVMRGNLRFKIKNRNFVLKTGNSVMDYLTILASPFEEAKQRLNPFASVLLGIEPVTELIPVTGTINRFKQLGIGPGKSLIPSVYMELYPNTLYTRRPYARTYNTRTWRRYPKKSYVKSNQSYIKYKYITNAYAMRKRSRSWMWLTSTTSITPNWYHDNYRLYKVNSRLNRARRKLKLPVYKI